MKYIRRAILILLIYMVAFTVFSNAESFAASKRVKLGTCSVTISKSVTYTGKKIKPKAKIIYKQKRLKLNRDYTVEYTNNIAAGTATATFKGIGEYKGTIKKKFTVKPRLLSKADVKTETDKFNFTGKTIKLRPKLVYAGKRLKRDIDYTVTYKNNLNCGTATAILKGIGNFRGTIRIPYEILPSSKVSFSMKSKSIKAGDHSQLLKIDGFTEKTIVNTVKSSSKHVIRVAHNGNGGIILEARNPGDATITAIVDGQLLSCKITVLPVYVESVAFDDPSAKYVKVGDVVKNKAVAYPEKATDRSLKYTSSNPEAAIVDENTGQVTAIAPGTASIKAKAKDGSKVYSKYKVYVRDYIKSDSTHFVAHRGLSSEAPENTEAAFRLAGQAGFWGIETDVRKSADGRFIISHDRSLLRSCGVEKNVEDMTFDEIKSMDVISGKNIEQYQGNCKIASLQEYLEICKEYACVPVIEVKMTCDEYAVTDPDYIDDTGVCEITRDTDYLLPMQYVTSDDLKSLYEQTREVMGTSSPYSFIAFDIRTAALLGQMAKAEDARNITIEHVTGPKTSLSNIKYYRDNNIELDAYYKMPLETITAFREAGIKVNLWVIDSQHKAWTVINNGIEYITTNTILWD